MLELNIYSILFLFHSSKYCVSPPLLTSVYQHFSPLFLLQTLVDQLDK